MKSPFETKTIHYTDCSSFEDFVSKIYNLDDYSIACTEEKSNDTVISFTPNGKINDYDQTNVDLIKESGEVPTYRTGLLFNMLVADGHLQPGEYQVEISW